MEKEKRERELAELRDRENRLDYTDLVFSGIPSNVLYFRMRDEMFRRGAMRIPGLPPHDPYLEASRRHAAALGQPNPYGRECSTNLTHNLNTLDGTLYKYFALQQLVLTGWLRSEWLWRGWPSPPWPPTPSSGYPEVRPQVECKIQDSLCNLSNHYDCLRFLRTLTLISTCTLMPPR